MKIKVYSIYNLDVRMFFYTDKQYALYVFNTKFLDNKYISIKIEYI